MCLATVNKNSQPCEEGYKVFYIRTDGQLVGAIMTNKSLPRGVWLDERDFRPRYMLHKRLIRRPGYWSQAIKYPVGWHTYHNLADAEAWAMSAQVCIKVQVGQPKATGFQADRHKHPVTVSRYIRIAK